MTMNNRIPLVDKLDFSQQLGDGLNAVLVELTAMLERLVRTSEEGQIDIRNLPLSTTEYHHLKELLGEGEATIELSLSGQTRCRETGVPGLWWVQHLTPTGTIAAEMIEVARIPHILDVDTSDIKAGLDTLRQRLRNASHEEESDHE